jgi:hypothetical protein
LGFKEPTYKWGAALCRKRDGKGVGKAILENGKAHSKHGPK